MIGSSDNSGGVEVGVQQNVASGFKSRFML